MTGKEFASLLDDAAFYASGFDSVEGAGYEWQPNDKGVFYIRTDKDPDVLPLFPTQRSETYTRADGVAWHYDYKQLNERLVVRWMVYE